MSVLTIDRGEMMTVQVKPDRTARNWRTDLLARDFHELFTPPLKRIKLEKAGLIYRPQERVCFDITMEASAIRFWFTFPTRWQQYICQKIETAWPKATILPGTPPKLPASSVAAEARMRYHPLLALATAKNDNRPLNSLLEVSKDLRDGDLARLQVLAVPYDRQIWEQEAVQAFKRFREGKSMQRQEFTMTALGAMLLQGLNQALEDANKFATDLTGSDLVDLDKKTDRKNDRITAAMRRTQTASEATTRKATEPVFATQIRLGVDSQEEHRATTLVKSMATALNDLAQDNELIRVDIKNTKEFTGLINQFRQPRVNLSPSLFGAGELGKLIQMPGAELLDEYKTIEQVPMRETSLPAILTNEGIPWCHHVLRGIRQLVCLPTANDDETCLPRIVIGGMGTGKTKGAGANLAVGAVQANMGSVTIDPARGELGDEIESALRPDQVVRIRFGKEPISLDWREVRHSDHARNRLANELVSFCEAASDDVGAQTVRFLRAAAKAAPTGKLQEMVALLTDPKVRKKAIPIMRPQEQATWKEFDTLSDARQAQIAGPVLNRLDVIMGDDYLAECMAAVRGIDFVQLLKQPRAIIIDIPKSDLGAEAVDVLASMIATKLDLAMVMRTSKHPVFIIQDEPHQYARSTRIWKAAAVESRKWRFSYCWMFHDWSQVDKNLRDIIKSALPHYHIYTSSKHTYKDLAEEIAPFTLEEAMATPIHWAINVIRAGGVTAPPFMAEMLLPPSERLAKKPEESRVGKKASPIKINFKFCLGF